MAGFKLPRLKANLAIVNGKGNPLDYFLRFWNTEVAPRIEKNEDSQNQTIADLAAIVAQLQAISASAQQAQETANQAQEAADAASGTGVVSGSNKDPAVSIPASSTWVNGPTVSLTGVVAGTLTITGSGPQQDGDVTMSGTNVGVSCTFRIVEIVSGVETTIFTGSFRVDKLESGIETPTVTNLSASDVQAFSSARSSTGAVDYRIDVMENGPIYRAIDSLLLYIFVRRAP